MPSRTRPALVLLSPPALCVLAVCLVNGTYTLIAAWSAATTGLTAVVPPSVARRLGVAGLNLTVPLVFTYNALLALGSLLLFLVPDFRRMTMESAELVRSRLGRAPVVAVCAAGSLLVAAVYLAIWSDAMLPMYQERVRWFTDQIPDATPVDQAVLVRAHYLLRLLGDIRYTVPLLNAVFPAALLWFLAAYFGGRSAVWVNLAVLAVLCSYGAAYYSTGADAEIPAAVFGMIGLLTVARGRVTLGLFWIWLALLFKSTALYFLVSAVVLALWPRRSRPAAWRELFSPLVGLMGVFLAFYYVNYVIYAATRGVTYLVHVRGDVFFWSPLREFASEIATLYPVILLLCVLALLFARGDRGVLLYATVSLIALRCTARVAGGYYTLFFVPLMMVLVAALFVRLAERRAGSLVVAALALVAFVSNAVGFVIHRDAVVSRRTMQWDAVIGGIDRALPPGSEVLYRQVSPKYDLERRGRGDLRFVYLPEDRVAALARLEAPGAKAYIAPGLDLSPETDRRLSDGGFRPLLGPVGPHGARFRVFLKSV